MLKVTDLPAGTTVFPNSADPKCFETSVPNQYLTNGFDQANTDLLVFMEIVNNTAASFVAQAGPCIFGRWAYYGMCRYNVHYVDTDLTKTGTFHANVLTTLHELTHILGVSSFLFGKVQISYESSTARDPAQVSSTSGGKTMIILEQTKLYVQNYFGCTDTSLGAMI